MVWVVDDDPELRKMVGTYLIDQGYDVRSVMSSNWRPGLSSASGSSGSGSDDAWR